MAFFEICYCTSDEEENDDEENANWEENDDEENANWEEDEIGICM